MTGPRDARPRRSQRHRAPSRRRRRAVPAQISPTQRVPAAVHAAAAGDSRQPAAPVSLIDAAWGLDPDSSRYLISLYRPNYFLPARYSDRPNEAPFDVLFNAFDKTDAELDSTEAEFQLSFKARLWATDDRRFGVWAAYTQRSQWQVYNSDLSAPFRETNYEPEVFVSYNPALSFGGFDWRLLNVGYNHQSNGRSDPISRSWDRVDRRVRHRARRLRPARPPLGRHRRRRGRQPGHHGLHGLGRRDGDVQVGGAQLHPDGPRQSRDGQGHGPAHLDVPAVPGPAARLRRGLQRLRRQPDRLQLVPEHDRRRHLPERSIWTVRGDWW